MKRYKIVDNTHPTHHFDIGTIVTEVKYTRRAGRENMWVEGMQDGKHIIQLVCVDDLRWKRDRRKER